MKRTADSVRVSCFILAVRRTFVANENTRAYPLVTNNSRCYKSRRERRCTCCTPSTATVPQFSSPQSRLRRANVCPPTKRRRHDVETSGRPGGGQQRYRRKSAKRQGTNDTVYLFDLYFDDFVLCGSCVRLNLDLKFEIFPVKSSPILDVNNRHLRADIHCRYWGAIILRINLNPYRY